MAKPKRSDSTAAAAAVSERPSSVGRVLDGRYRIEERLGAGGVGAVYRGTQVALGRPVAIKILHEGVHPSFTQRFEREAKALASLRHPNIVQVTDYGVDGDMPYLVMELLEGETLAYRLMQGRMQPEEVLELTRQLLRALTFVHEQGLVHRDLKPGNVFLEKLPDGERRLKLLDFGLAKFVHGQAAREDPPVTRAGDIVGTPAYIAPEQVAGDAIDPRTDTYSVGVMLFQMLCGRVPFEGEPVEQLKAHLVSPVPSLRDKNPGLQPRPELEALLQRAMSKQRDARFQTCAEMMAELEAVPTPWFGPSEARDAGLASTVLSQPPDALEGRTELRQGPTDTQVIRHVRAYATLALAAISSLAIGLAAYLLAGKSGSEPPAAAPPPRPSAAARPATRNAAVPARPAAAPAPSIMARAAAASAEPATPAQATSAAAAEPAAEAEAATAAQAATETETATVATAAATPPGSSAAAPAGSSRPPARNPWARGTPKELRSLRKAIAAGEYGSDRAIMLLRRFNRSDPTETRGHLLLAQLYMNRNWRADVVNQYAIVYQRDPSARGAPEMLRDLLRIVAHGASGSNEAARLIREAYGREALPAIERAMTAWRANEPALARLATLRAAITQR